MGERTLNRNQRDTITKKSKELEKIKERLLQAISYRQYLYKDKDWENFEQYWMGNYPVHQNIEAMSIRIPILVADAQRQKAELLGREPMIEVEATDPEDVPSARIHQIILNKIFKDSHVFEQTLDAIQDSLTLGTGFMMDGYGSQYGTYSETAIIGFDSSMQGKSERIEYDDYLSEDAPWSMRVHPMDIYLPVGTVRLNQAYGYFQRYSRHIDEVRQDTKLNANRMKIRPNMKVDYMGPAHAKSIQRPEFLDKEYVILWDWMDLRTNMRTTFSFDSPHVLYQGVDEILIRLNRLNIHDIVFNRNSRYFWGTSTFDFLEPMQKEINLKRTYQMVMRRLEIPKMILNLDALDETDLDADMLNEAMTDLESDSFLAFIKQRGDPSKFMYQITPRSIDPNDSDVSTIKNDMREFMGMGQPQRGQVAQGRHTKHEVALADQYYDKSLNPQRRVLQNMFIQMAENWSELIFDFWTKPMLVRTLDAAGRPVVVRYRGEQLRGNYRYRVMLDSMQDRGRSRKLEEARMLWQLGLPMSQAGIIDPANLFRQVSAITDFGWDVESLLTRAAEPQQAPKEFERFQKEFYVKQQDREQQPNLLAGISPADLKEGQS